MITVIRRRGQMIFDAIRAVEFESDRQVVFRLFWICAAEHVDRAFIRQIETNVSVRY